MLIAGFPAGPWGTNCYVVATGPGQECVVVDPGKDAADGVAGVVREHNLKPVSVLVTHGHIDHMWCVAPVSGTYDATAYIHPADRHLLSDPMAGMSRETAGMLLGRKYEFAEPDEVSELGDGQTLELAGLEFLVDHTPGHTPARSPSGRRTTSRTSPRSCSPGTCSSPAPSVGPTSPAATIRRCCGAWPPRCCRCATTSSCCPATVSRPASRASAPPTPTSSTSSATRASRHLPHQRPLGPMSKPTPLSGFPELLPEQKFVEQRVTDSLRRTFELHGFAPVETRAVEPLDNLLRKGETSKEVYVLRRLQADPEQADTDAGIGLHFDLTVPFARYVLENAGKLEFPFRRYQIQKAWRGGPRRGATASSPRPTSTSS